MTYLCLRPPTPAFRIGYIYWGEVIPSGFVAYDDEGYSWAADTVTFRTHFTILKI